MAQTDKLAEKESAKEPEETKQQDLKVGKKKKGKKEVFNSIEELISANVLKDTKESGHQKAKVNFTPTGAEKESEGEEIKNAIIITAVDLQIQEAHLRQIFNKYVLGKVRELPGYFIIELQNESDRQGALSLNKTKFLTGTLLIDKYDLSQENPQVQASHKSFSGYRREDNASYDQGDSDRGRPHSHYPPRDDYAQPRTFSVGSKFGGQQPRSEEPAEGAYRPPREPRDAGAFHSRPHHDQPSYGDRAPPAPPAFKLGSKTAPSQPVPGQTNYERLSSMKGRN